MENAMFTLKSNVMLIERDGQVGLILCGLTKFAKDERQADILRALISQRQPLEILFALLQMRGSSPISDNEISLVIAEFILDFGEYLQS